MIFLSIPLALACCYMAATIIAKALVAKLSENDKAHLAMYCLCAIVLGTDALLHIYHI